MGVCTGIHACGFKAALKAGPDGGAQYFSCYLLLGFLFVFWSCRSLIMTLGSALVIVACLTF